MPEEKNFFNLSHFRSVEYKPSNVTEKQILNGILNREDKMYRFIYKFYFPSVKSIVTGFHNLTLDADDIFQEALIAASLNIEKGKFNGESSFQTYLVAISRNLCLKKIDRNRKMIFTSVENIDVMEEMYPGQEELVHRMMSIKEKMEEKCREIFNLRFGLTTGSSMHFDEISGVLGIEADNARQRFKRCLDKLRSLMVNDHSFKMILTTS